MRGWHQCCPQERKTTKKSSLLLLLVAICVIIREKDQRMSIPPRWLVPSAQDNNDEEIGSSSSSPLVPYAREIDAEVLNVGSIGIDVVRERYRRGVIDEESTSLPLFCIGPVNRKGAPRGGDVSSSSALALSTRENDEESNTPPRMAVRGWPQKRRTGRERDGRRWAVAERNMRKASIYSLPVVGVVREKRTTRRCRSPPRFCGCCPQERQPTRGSR